MGGARFTQARTEAAVARLFVGIMVGRGGDPGKQRHWPATMRSTANTAVARGLEFRREANSCR